MPENVPEKTRLWEAGSRCRYTEPHTWLGLNLSGTLFDIHSLSSPGMAFIPQIHKATHEKVTQNLHDAEHRACLDFIFLSVVCNARQNSSAFPNERFPGFHGIHGFGFSLARPLPALLQRTQPGTFLTFYSTLIPQAWVCWLQTSPKP